MSWSWHLTHGPVVTVAVPSTSLPSITFPTTFDVSKHIALVPLFRETYFAAFERIASALQWPSDVWPLLLQCKIHGEAQDA